MKHKSNMDLENGYELHQKMLDSQGMQFLDRMRAHSFSYNIFSMNYHEITEALKIMGNPEIGIKLFEIDNREAGDQVYREINRLFHNFLASAQTLVEHTRIFMRSHYKNTEFYQLYCNKITDEFANDTLSKFIQDLRNYMLHKGLPHSNMTLKGSIEGQIETFISLDAIKLLSWKKWSPSSKNLLLEHETINIDELVVSYGEKIKGLYDWLNKQLESHHENDLSELRNMQEVYNLNYGCR